MATRVPSRARQRKYGYVERGDGENSDDPRFIGCPTLVDPAHEAYVLEETATLIWSSVAGATSYNVYFWRQGDQEPQPINVEGNSYDVAVEFGVTYFWRVTAVNDFGESSGCSYGLDVILQPGQNGKKSFDVTESLVSLSDDEYVVTDDQEFATIIAVRVGSSGAATVQYATSDETAQAGVHYTQTSGTLNWPDAEEGNKTFQVPILPLALVEELTTDVLYPWSPEESDPRGANTHEYRVGSGAEITTPVSNPWVSTIETAAANFLAANGWSAQIENVRGWTKTGETNKTAPYDAIDAGEIETLTLYFSQFDDEDYEDVSIPALANPCTALSSATSIGTQTFWWGGRYDSSSTKVEPSGKVEAWLDPEVNPDSPDFGSGLDAGYSALSGCFGGNNGWPGDPTPVWGLYIAMDMPIEVRRSPAPPPNPTSEFPDWPRDPDNFWWDESTGQLYSKQPWAEVSGDYRWLSTYVVSGSDVIRYPLAPALEAGDASDTEEFWTAAYEAAVLAGDLPSGMTYRADGGGSFDTYPRNSSYAYYRSYKLPVWFNVGLSNATGATLVEPDSATVYIMPS